MNIIVQTNQMYKEAAARVTYRNIPVRVSAEFRANPGHVYGAAGLITAGILGTSALMQHIRKAYSNAAIRNVEQHQANQAAGVPTSSIMDLAENHPYATGLGADVAALYTGGLSKVITSPTERAAGIMLADRVHNKGAYGIGGQFANHHPFLGSLGGNIIPGLGANKYVAGESIARDVLSDPNSFSYNHPNVVSTFANFLPGYGSAWGHAAARIEHEQNKKL